MKVQNGQNIFDVCLQEFGDLEVLFEELLIPNDLTLNSDLQADLYLNLNTSGKGNQELKDFGDTPRSVIDNIGDRLERCTHCVELYVKYSVIDMVLSKR